MTMSAREWKCRKRHKTWQRVSDTIHDNLMSNGLYEISVTVDDKNPDINIITVCVFFIFYFCFKYLYIKTCSCYITKSYVNILHNNECSHLLKKQKSSKYFELIKKIIFQCFLDRRTKPLHFARHSDQL